MLAPIGRVLSFLCLILQLFMELLYIVAGVAVVGLLYSLFKSIWVNKQSPGNEAMQKIGGHISRGARAFLKAEYSALAIFVVVVAVLLGLLATDSSHWTIAIAFVLGAGLSALAGFLGMTIATKSNTRTTEAARTSLGKALNISFSGGLVMGLNVVSLGLLGIVLLYLLILNLPSIAGNALGNMEDMRRVLEILIGFSLGAESIATFRSRWWGYLY